MTDLRRERARIRSALRVEAADMLKVYLDLEDIVGTDDRSSRLWNVAQTEAERLCLALRTGRAIGPLTSRRKTARKGSE